MRAGLEREGADGLLVPLTDEHRSEYVGAYARRLEWLTGFTGSAGTAAVLRRSAALFTDGRYRIQAAAECDPDLISVEAAPALADWLSGRLNAGGALLYDPWLHTRAEIEALRGQLGGRLALRAVSPNPVDGLWTDRPLPSRAPAQAHDLEHAGQSSSEKRRAAAATVAASGAETFLVCALDSVAWLLNLRGCDVPFTPVVRAFAAIRSDATAILFIDPAKLTPEVAAHLGPDVEIRPYEGILDWCSGEAPATVSLDPATTVEALRHALGERRVVEVEDPCVWPRALKTPRERRNAREVHRRDGAALCRFLHWIERDAVELGVDELEAAAALEANRRVYNDYREPSFATISAVGPNAALPHYRPRPGSARTLTSGTLFLVDSGGQYDGATTDVTRTVALGEPSPTMRRHFTLALKGHLAVAMAGLPRGVVGGELDPLARQHLWAEGLDYATGTGHGVGTCLSVHEGPVFIGRRGGTRPVDAPLRPGLLLTIEPGLYLEGEYGVRTENVYEVVERGEGWMAFEPLTLAPIDRALIEAGLLTPAERAWLDDYHGRVLTEIGPALDPRERDWLARACAPL